MPYKVEQSDVKNKHLPKEKCCNKSIIPNIGIEYIILFLTVRNLNLKKFKNKETPSYELRFKIEM